MTASRVDDVADELYALPAGDFIAARDGRAAEVRADGDRETAAAIKKLRKPSSSAWLANMLVRHRQDEIAELADLGDALREAQTNLSGDELRSLTRQRRQLIDRLLPAARALATELGQPVSESVLQELEGTLQAALVDPSAAEAVSGGRLATAVQVETTFGFGSAPMPAPASIDTKRRERAAAKKRAEEDANDTDRVARARRKLDEATGAADAAERTADERLAAAEDADERLAQASARVEELNAELREAREVRNRADTEARRARDRSTAATRAADDARKQQRAAKEALDDLAE
ncbi:MAG: hypothetical protein GEV10_22820 [Streptosporangiales bacterium]|nr:hypothetical protein [Streptosporangiales bacterium]